MGFVSANAPGEGIKWEDFNGKLLVIEPLSVEEHVPTVHTKPGEKSPAVRANVYVITGPETSEDYIDTLIFPKILQSQVRGQVGEMVCGRLGQGTKKPGQSAPWVIAEATADDISKAQHWDNARSKKPAFASASSSGAVDPWASKPAADEEPPF